MRKIFRQNCIQNQNTYFIFNTFFFSLESLVVREVMWGKKIYFTAGQATDDSWAFHAGNLGLQTHTQNMYYILLFHCNNG